MFEKIDLEKISTLEIWTIFLSVIGTLFLISTIIVDLNSLVQYILILFPIFSIVSIKFFSNVNETTFYKSFDSISLHAFYTPTLAIFFRSIVYYDIVYDIYFLIPFLILFDLSFFSLFFLVKEVKKSYPIFIVFCLMYSFGTTIILNCVLDKSQPQIFLGDIKRKYSTGKQNIIVIHSNELENFNKKITVNITEYKNYLKDDKICINVKDGFFYLKWFYIQKQMINKTCYCKCK